MDNDIHNWYEHLVFEKLADVSQADPKWDEDNLSDIACIALNHLPPRYVRHTVDMSFYTSPQEKSEMAERIDVAVRHAIDHIQNHALNKSA